MASTPYRSRLQRVEEQRSFRRSILFIVLSIIIVAGLIGVGIPLITGVTGFFVKQPGDDNVNDKIPPAPPILQVPYPATNSATLTVRGRAEAGAEVYVTRNSTALGNKKTNDQGDFSFDDITLVDGSNQFVAVAMDTAGNKSQPSSATTVIFSTTLPKLEVAQPQDGQVIHGTNTSLEIKGQTDTGNRVMINDRFLIVSGNGNFSTLTTLTEGENMFTIVATNLVGNQSRKEMKVTYQP